MPSGLKAAWSPAAPDGRRRDREAWPDLVVCTVSGRHVHLLDPRPADIDFGDVATSLSRLTRFNGHTPLTVAHHSVMVAHCVSEAYADLGAAADAYGDSAEVVLAALLHDAHEAYLGDLSTPVKRLAGETVAPNSALDISARRLDEAIAAAAGIEAATMRCDLVRAADLRSLYYEATRFVGVGYKAPWLDAIWRDVRDSPFAFPGPQYFREQFGRTVKRQWFRDHIARLIAELPARILKFDDRGAEA